MSCIFDLANNYLTGPVPKKLASLSMLNLNLNNNSLNGMISFIHNSPNVQYVQLDNNKFSGPLHNFDAYSVPQIFPVSHNRLARPESKYPTFEYMLYIFAK